MVCITPMPSGFSLHANNSCWPAINHVRLNQFSWLVFLLSLSLCLTMCVSLSRFGNAADGVCFFVSWICRVLFPGSVLFRVFDWESFCLRKFVYIVCALFVVCCCLLRMLSIRMSNVHIHSVFIWPTQQFIFMCRWWSTIKFTVFFPFAPDGPQLAIISQKG